MYRHHKKQINIAPGLGSSSNTRTVVEQDTPYIPERFGDANSEWLTVNWIVYLQ